MAQWCATYGVEIWCYGLMPHHVHLIATPGAAEGCSRVMGEAHRRYPRRINLRQGWRGDVWQGRFASWPLEARSLLAASRYIELHPVRAQLVMRAGPCDGAG
ncbi:MAG: transposase [Candidatus Tectomicrobia bacterium]